MTSHPAVWYGRWRHIDVDQSYDAHAANCAISSSSSAATFAFAAKKRKMTFISFQAKTLHARKQIYRLIKYS